MPLEETKPGVEFLIPNKGDPTSHQSLIFPHVETITAPDGTMTKTEIDGVSTYDVIDALVARVRSVKDEAFASEANSAIENLKAAKDWLDLAKTRGLKAV